MFGQLRSLLMVGSLCLTLQLCFEYGQTFTPMHEEHLGAGEGERSNPLSSYYRHNIYGPKSYAFGFEVSDKTRGNIQYRDEKRYSNGSIEGSFGYVRPDDSVSITHYTADSKEGYTSQTKSVLPGEDVEWFESGSTSKQGVLKERHQESATSEATYNDREKFNLTSILLPVEEIKQQHSIDINPQQLEKELVNPAILEVINGQAPLVTDNSNKGDQAIGFATVSKFIPSQFPLTPFELPPDKIVSLDVKANGDDGDNSKTVVSKYDKQKINNSEKLQPLHDPSPPSITQLKANQGQKSESSTSNGHIKTTEEATSSTVKVDDWYDRIIDQARKKYLRGLR